MIIKKKYNFIFLTFLHIFFYVHTNKKNVIIAFEVEEIAIKLPIQNPVSQDINRTLNAIKTQKMEDKFGWIVEAK